METKASLFWFSHMAVCVFTSTITRDTFTFKVTFSSLPGFSFCFFNCTPLVNMKSITWHHPGNGLIFFRGWLSWRFTWDTGVVPGRWIIDLMPRGNMKGLCCQWQKGHLQSWTRNVFVNGAWGQWDWGCTTGSLKTVRGERNRGLRAKITGGD